MKLDDVQRDILKLGLDDFVGLWEVARCVRRRTSLVENTAVRVAAIERLRPLIAAGLLEPGRSPYEAGGFEEWHLPPEAAIERIAAEWAGLGRDPTVHEICWFSNSESGSAIVRDQAPM